jgi:hypothetical protein
VTSARSVPARAYLICALADPSATIGGDAQMTSIWSDVTSAGIGNYRACG